MLNRWKHNLNWQRQNEKSIGYGQLICYEQLNIIPRKVHHAFYNANLKQKENPNLPSTEIHHTDIIFNYTFLWDLHIIFSSDNLTSLFCQKRQSGSYSGPYQLSSPPCSRPWSAHINQETNSFVLYKTMT